MFSYEYRIKAVKLYIALGNRSAAAIRILGYPSKKYLRRWYLTYIDTGELPKKYKRKPRYSDEQNQQAVEHYFNHGQCLAHTQKVLGYPCAEILNIWLDEIKPDILRKRYTQALSVHPGQAHDQRVAITLRMITLLSLCRVTTAMKLNQNVDFLLELNV